MRKWIHKTIMGSGLQSRSDLCFWAAAFSAVWIAMRCLSVLLFGGDWGYSGGAGRLLSDAARLLLLLIACETLRTCFLRQLAGEEKRLRRWVTACLVTVVFSVTPAVWRLFWQDGTAMLRSSTGLAVWLPALAASAVVSVLELHGGLLPGLIFRIGCGVLPLLIPIRPAIPQNFAFAGSAVLYLLFLLILDLDLTPGDSGQEASGIDADRRSASRRGEARAAAGDPDGFSADGCRETSSISDNLNPQRSHRSGIAGWIVTLGLLTLIVCFSAGILPVRSVAVLTGSMAPELEAGDLVIVKNCGMGAVHEGDIIQFRQDSVSVVHRIVGTVEQDGSVAWITKGDANNAEDSGEVTEDELVGKVLLRIPKLGRITMWLHGL